MPFKDDVEIVEEPRHTTGFSRYLLNGCICVCGRVAFAHDTSCQQLFTAEVQQLHRLGLSLP